VVVEEDKNKESDDQMMLSELRKTVCDCNLTLPKAGLVVMTSGNVSGRDPESGLVVIKPSGYRYDQLSPEDLVIVDLDGNVVEGNLKPSVDTATHLYVYRHRSDVHGMVHTHSTYASVFAALGKPIPACLTTSAQLGGEVPLGDFVAIGGENIGKEIVSKIGKSLAIIMQNHGVFTIGKDAQQATKMAVEVEEIAKITYLAMVAGDPVLLSSDQIAQTHSLYTETYGQK
jgi:L-ribulose-5-phosphate 4-epimerase